MILYVTCQYVSLYIETHPNPESQARSFFGSETFVGQGRGTTGAEVNRKSEILAVFRYWGNSMDIGFSMIFYGLS